jgi:DNA topoisomerase-1
MTRRRSGRGFTYLDPDGRRVRSRDELARFRSLAIPPAWTDVWICADPAGHIQATGRDARGRLQYRYHARFRARRDADKFGRLVRFGRRLPRIRARIRQDLRRPGLPREKVLAAILDLLEATHFRVGNEEYARLNRSFGLSTLRNRHARVEGATIRFRFRGKGGRPVERTLVDRRMAAIVRRCQDLPGQQLFQYVDDDGEARAVASEDVNEYLREAAGADEFSAKDLRTWAATLVAFRALATRGEPSSDDPRDAIRAAVAASAEAIGDTVAVTRGSYVHPAVLEAAEDREPPRAKEAPASDGEGRRSQPSHPPDLDGRPTRREELAALRLLEARARAPRRTRRPAAQGASRICKPRATPRWHAGHG